MENNVNNSPFSNILLEMRELYDKKNHDYGNSFQTLFDKIGMPYAYGHMAEKLERVYSLMSKEGKVEESMRDSIIDLANYCVLTIIELDSHANK